MYGYALPLANVAISDALLAVSRETCVYTVERFVHIFARAFSPGAIIVPKISPPKTGSRVGFGPTIIRHDVLDMTGMAWSAY